MRSDVLDEIIERTGVLSPEEKLRLITRLAEDLQTAYPGSRPRRKWREICGAAPWPLAGEDAQAWVSRSRQEVDEHREQHRKGSTRCHKFR